VIGDEVRRQGYCDLSQREIARRADVTMRTVDRRLDHLAEAGMISISPRTGAFGQSITNIARITSPTWRAVLGLS
jgi:DNA-binding transcriptional regulator YhcF (GntR family)